jgi:hypothetical protein
MNIIGNPKYLHIGTKAVLALAMTRQEYNDYRDWKLPDDEQHLANEQGFLVEYMDGGRANHKDHVGYISWSPKDVFEQSYKPNGSFSFGDAVELLKTGKRVARSGWNGKGMWLSYLDPYHNNQFSITEKNGAEGTFSPYIGMKTADNKYIPWLASQTDMLAEDWGIVQ